MRRDKCLCLNPNNRFCFRDDDRILRKKPKPRRIKKSNRNRNGDRSNSLPIINDKSRNAHLFLHSIRIAFGFMFILLIILSVISSFPYVVDLFLQSSCRLVHNDQPFLISLLTGNQNNLENLENFCFIFR